MPESEYQKEQREALELVERHLSGFTQKELADLTDLVSDYLLFRHDVDLFLAKHFSHICTETCYQSRLSACCTRDGIITFFADVVINALESSEVSIQKLQERLKSPHQGSKCIYLSEKGCLWRVKPLVCEMFLCAKAEKAVFPKDQQAQEEWAALRQRAKSFRWPDRPVLFDRLEEIFIEAGHSSTLMYLHNSPGLLRVKKLTILD